MSYVSGLDPESEGHSTYLAIRKCFEEAHTDVVKIHPLIRSEIAQDSGDGDVWGWGLSHLFDVSLALYFRGEDIPSKWAFKTGANSGDETIHRQESYTMNSLLEMYDAREITGDDLRTAGSVLLRYTDRVKFHGLDY